MSFKKSNGIYFADTKADLELILAAMGEECWVIEEADKYMAMSDGTWVKQTSDDEAAITKEEVASMIPDTSNFMTKEEMSDFALKSDIPNVSDFASKSDIPDVSKFLSKEYVDAFYSPKKYEITTVPKGTIVDYREKEIRVFCPESVEFTKQNVGANGDASMHYMTFKAYAPEGAVSFKEGDRGVIIDEMHDFKSSAAGTDKFGRNYSVLWLALAKFDEASGTWNYFGKTSTIEKMIGWTYCVEWYDADGVMIGTDKIRINLSNADCHLNLNPYLG